MNASSSAKTRIEKLKSLLQERRTILNNLKVKPIQISYQQNIGIFHLISEAIPSLLLDEAAQTENNLSLQTKLLRNNELQDQFSKLSRENNE